MASRHETAHLESLRILCEQAQKLSQEADTLCKRLAKRLEATRASVRLPERRRKNRKKG